MGREIRRVPLDWVHPVYTEENAKSAEWVGSFIPMFDADYETVANKWLTECWKWECNIHPDRPKSECRYYWERAGDPPDRECYRERKWTAEEAIGYQVYETVTEGTPKSPVFQSEMEVVQWCVEQGHSREVACAFVASGWAPSGICTGGRLTFGIDSAAL